MSNELHLTPQVIKDVLQKPETELNQIQDALKKAIKGGRSDAEVLAILEEAVLGETRSDLRARSITIRIRL